ncbi:MAG: T9SS type A sorting domain-containing protein [Bacteroidota bacterium]|nr:T9SS type A sorting domain-containing protein [Bacteroidota bacterium]
MEISKLVKQFYIEHVLQFKHFTPLQIISAAQPDKVGTGTQHPSVQVPKESSKGIPLGPSGQVRSIPPPEGQAIYITNKIFYYSRQNNKTNNNMELGMKFDRNENTETKKINNALYKESPMIQRLHHAILLGLVSITLCTAQHIYDNRIDTSCGLVWGPVWQLTPDSVDAGVPVIVNQGDTLHITVLSNNSGLRFPYIRSVDGGKTFEPLRKLAPDSIELVSGCIFVPTRKALYAFWRDAVSRILYMMMSTDQGLNWSPPQLVMDSMSIAWWYRAGIEDTILLGVNRDQGTGNIHGMLRTTDAGETWTLLGPIDQRINSDIAFLPGKLYRVFGWEYDSSGYSSEYLVVQYKVSTDLGMTWSDSINLSSVRGGSFTANSNIAADPSTGTIVVSWRDAKYGCEGLVGCSIMERHLIHSDSSWTSEVVLTDRPNGYRPKIAVRDNYVVVTWPEEPENKINLKYFNLNHKQWSSVCDVYPSIIVGLFPSCAIFKNTFHVVWMARESNFLPDKIFYRRVELLPTDVKEQEALPSSVELHQNYPNPFNPKTKIGFRLQVSGFTSLKVYDIFGREVAVLVNEKLEAGEHEIEWDPSTSFGSAQDGGSGQVLASGIYFYRIVQGNYTSVGKAVFLK